MLARAQIKNGRLVLQHDSAVDRLFKLNEGKHIWVDIHVNRPKRSNEQNRYYWGVVCKLVSEATGYTPEEVHEFNKDQFLSEFSQEPGKLPEMISIGGEHTIKIKTTKQLNTKEFIEFIDTMVKFYAEQDIYIPLPNEVEMMGAA